jgi:hypothetical protein
VKQYSKTLRVLLFSAFFSPSAQNGLKFWLSFVFFPESGDLAFDKRDKSPPFLFVAKNALRKSAGV